jgi:type IV pilus assembly protein PilO
MGLLPQNARDQKLLVMSMLVAGLGGLYHQYMWTPKRAELDIVEKRVVALDSINRSAKIEIAKGTAAKMRAEADNYQRQLDVLRRLVPTENEVPALLEAVSESARRAGLEFSDVVPDGVVQGDQFDAYRYRIAVVGPFHRLAEFLDNVGSLPRIVAPMNLALVPSQRATTERKPQKGEQFLEARLQIQTYVDPATAGPNQVHVTAFAADGTALEVVRPAIVATPPEGAVQPLEPLTAGTGHFVANVDLTPGTWRFDVTCVASTGGGTLRSTVEREIGD